MSRESHTVSSVEATVMRRVYAMHLLQTFLAPAAFSAFIFVLALWGIGREVWVAHVFANMPSLTHVAALARFTEFAFLHTRAIVQILVVLVLAAGIGFVLNVVRLLRQPIRYA